MIPRHVQPAIERALREQAAVLLLGPPRVGRSTLCDAFAVADPETVRRFDGGRDNDRVQLSELVVGGLPSAQLIIVDNIDERSLEYVDALLSANQAKSLCRFLLLPRHQSFVRALKATLAGRVCPLELPPIQPDEAFTAATQSQLPPLMGQIGEEPSEAPAREWDQSVHWLRGGFPESLFAVDDGTSLRWRLSYLDTILTGDHSAWNLNPEDNVPAVFAALSRRHGMPCNIEKAAEEVGIKKAQFVRVVTSLSGMGLVRFLRNWAEDDDAPEVVLVRDSGLQLAQRGIGDMPRLRSDDELCGHSWEGFATEALLQAVHPSEFGYYRNAAGDEIDLALDIARVGRRFAIEFKVGEDRDVEPGFWRAANAIRATDHMLVHSGRSSDHNARPPRLALPVAIDLLRGL